MPTTHNALFKPLVLFLGLAAAALFAALAAYSLRQFDEAPPIVAPIVPTGDAAALATALETLMRDPEHAIAMGERGRERVSAQFSIEREAAGIQSVYESVRG